MSAKIDISFGDWLGLALKHGDLMLPMWTMGILMFAALAIGLIIPVIGFPVLAGIGIAFLLALRYAWLQECRNPPWYLVEHAKERVKCKSR